jgi:hypothetical protein
MPPIPGNQDTIWIYPTVETSEDKRTTRLGVTPPKSYEIIGADGLTEGGLHIFPGFKTVHEFKYGQGSFNTPNHDQSSKVIDVFPINFTIGDDGYGYGFIYRVRRKSVLGVNSTLADVFIDYYNSHNTTWVRGSLVKAGVPVSHTEDVSGKQMSVSVFGRYIYIFIEDQDVFSITCLQDSPWTLQAYITPGPGKQPELLSPATAGLIGLSNDTTRAGLPGYGKLFLTNNVPPDLGAGALWDTLKNRDGTTHTGSGTGYVYPDVYEDLKMIKPGDYAFGYVLFDSKTGRRSALSKIATAQENPDFIPSPLTSSIYLYAMLELVYDSSKWDQCYIYRSVQVESAGGTYVASIMHLERIITLQDYCTKLNSPAMPNNTKHVTYWYTLDDKQLVYQDVFMDRSLFDEKMPKGGVSTMYEGSMIVANISSQSTSSSTENRPNDAFTGLGELRWSSLTDPSPELFPPGNIYVPSIQSNEIIAMRQAGPNVIAFSRDRQYHIRKESNYIKVQEMHEGFGVINERALDTVGSLVYFVTTKGVKAVDTQGALDDVRSLNNLIMTDWATSLDSISVAFDPVLSALFVHNADNEHTACFWFTTACVTELYDTTFTQVVRGPWPQNFNLTTDSNSEYLNPLTERCFWLKNPQPDITSVSTAKWQLMVVDYTRDKTQGSGSRSGDLQMTLMPYSGDSVFTVGLDGVPYVTESGSTQVPTDVNGCYLYVLNSNDRSLIGAKCMIKEKGTTGPSSTREIRLYGGGAFEAALRVGDVVGISPVYFRWVGGPIIPQAEDGTQTGMTQDWFRVKHVKTIVPHFTGVDGSSIIDFPTACRYRGLVYRGNSTTPVYGETFDRNGNLVQSVLEDNPKWAAAFGSNNNPASGLYGVDGSTLSPGIEIFCPNLDYMLSGVMVSGSMRSTFRAGEVS